MVDRSQAISIVHEELCVSDVTAARWVTVFERLGVLKLEQTKTAEEKALEALRKDGYEASYLIAALNKFGFKIVEK